MKAALLPLTVRPEPMPTAVLINAYEAAFADFRRDADIPDDCPMSPVLWEEFEDWLREFDDPLSTEEWAEFRDNERCEAEFPDLDYKPSSNNRMAF